MKAILVAGLGFGDEGKGSIVDSLVRQTKAELVIRYNGGAQAAHHVVLDDGREHCFSQFGSGTFAGAKTYLSRFMMIEPAALQNEADHLQEIGVDHPFDLLAIDPDAPIITPYHRAMNRLRESIRGEFRHGSCGLGIGELGSDIEENREILTIGTLLTSPERFVLTTLDNIRERFYIEALKLIEENPETEEDLSQFVKLFHFSAQIWLTDMKDRLQYVRLGDWPSYDTIIFEGAQGVLLDEKYGFHPHTTWSNTTFDNAMTLLNEANFIDERIRIGVTRSYMTRHGAGPLPTEDNLNIPQNHNVFNQWQQALRVGHCDLPLLRYAVDVIHGVDQLAITHLDKVENPWKVATSYQGWGSLTPGDRMHQIVVTSFLKNVIPHYETILNKNDFLETLETIAPLGILSSGPTAIAKVYLPVKKDNLHGSYI